MLKFIGKMLDKITGLAPHQTIWNEKAHTLVNYAENKKSESHDEALDIPKPLQKLIQQLDKLLDFEEKVEKTSAEKEQMAEEESSKLINQHRQKELTKENQTPNTISRN